MSAAPVKQSTGHDEIRLRIIQAARRCIERRGYHKTTVSDICHEAGLPARALYRYFPNRESVINASAELETKLYRDILSSLAEQAKVSGRDPMLDLQERMLGLLQTPQMFGNWVHNIEWWAAAARHPQILSGFQATWRAWQEALDPLIEDSLGVGLDFDRSVVAMFLVASYNGLLLHAALDSEALNFHQLSQLILKLWLLLKEST